MMELKLLNINDTEKLGKQLANTINNFYIKDKTLPFQALFLHGTLGCGKTHLTSSLVRHLPQLDVVEVSSPSFTLCNNYATSPEVLHVDLYRCESNIPNELWEALDMDELLCIVEWAEYIPHEAMPQNFLDIFFKICEQERIVSIQACGAKAELFLQSLKENFSHHI